MKPPLFLLAAVSLVLSAGAASPVKNEITQIDASGQALTVSDGRGQFKTYHFKPTTEVLINNQRSTGAALTPGMVVAVTTGDPGVAARIVATSKAGVIDTAKPAPAESKLKFSASTGEEKPHVVGVVKTGQKVTITPIKVWWEGGGTHHGTFCDWSGYPGSQNTHGKPWMALIAQVGDSYFAPANNVLTFSVPQDGTLVLFANDNKPEDNQGSASISVTITGP